MLGKTEHTNHIKRKQTDFDLMLIGIRVASFKTYVQNTM